MSCQSLFVLEYDPSGCVWVIFMFLLICLQCFWGLSKSTCLQILLLVAEHTSVSQANTVHAETTESLHTPPILNVLVCSHSHFYDTWACCTCVVWIASESRWLDQCYWRIYAMKKKKSVGLYGVIDRKRPFHMTSTQELGLHMKSNANGITDRWFCRVTRLQENWEFTRDR